MEFKMYDEIDKDDLPLECIEACSASGQVDEPVAHWQKELNFSINPQDARDHLQAYGAWEDEELEAKSETELNQIVLWLVCCDISEQGSAYISK